MAEEHKRGVMSRIAVLRLLAFFFVPAFVYGIGGLTIMRITPLLAADIRDVFRVGSAVVVGALVIVTYLLLVRHMEHRPAKELAPLRGSALLAGGMLIAFVMFCVVYGVLAGLGDAHWRGILGYGHVGAFVAMAIMSGVGEEIIFRGGMYRILEDAFGSGAALILSGAAFGAMHLGNPHATMMSAAAIALEAGVLLGAAYAATRSLWLPIGIHIGWNFTEGGVFGASVSGSKAGQGILDFPLTGSDTLTGGGFGPEASAVTVAICLVIGIVFVVRTVRRGRWVPVSFHMLLD